MNEQKTIQTDLFGNEVKDVKALKNKSGAFNFNPCISVHGAGPDGTRCKNCVHIIRKSFSKVYYKCELRGDTNGPATDHRANWPTCGKYELDK